MTINEEQLREARLAWGNGVIAISKAYEELDITEAKIIANDFLDVAVITDSKLRTKKTIKKLKNIAGRILEKK